MFSQDRKGHPAQLDLSHNPSYIPTWAYDMYRGRLNGRSQPHITWDTPVAVVIPLRNSQDHVNEMLASLFGQTFKNVHIYLVGNKGDKTWGGIDPQILAGAGINLKRAPTSMNPSFFASPVDSVSVWKGTYITLIEIGVPENWEGRDSNLKRNIGALMAVYDGAQYIFFTDAKIVREDNWIEFALTTMADAGVGSMAGEMVGTPDSRKTFWGRFADEALISRNPRFGLRRLLSLLNFDESESLPITSTLVTSVLDYLRSGGLDIRTTISYEDYVFDWRLVLAGVVILCTSLWQVLHKHRQGFKRVMREYRRSGGGAGQMYYLYPECTFGIKRYKQVKNVFLATVIGISAFAALFLFKAWFFLASLIGFCMVVYVMLGVLNIITAKLYIRAFAFPFFSGCGIATFAYGFMHQIYTKGGGGEILQTFWVL